MKTIFIIKYKKFEYGGLTDDDVYVFDNREQAALELDKLYHKCFDESGKKYMGKYDHYTENDSFYISKGDDDVEYTAEIRESELNKGIF